MPAESISYWLESRFDFSNIVWTAAAGITAYGVKIYTSGRKCIWEREWAGKLIIIAAPPDPTTLALIDHLLHLPSPPQILYLPPYASPLPESLLTLLNTLKLGIDNPMAGLHCEPLPPTPRGVRDFIRKWGAPLKGSTGEEGRRVDAVILGGAWECREPAQSGGTSLDDLGADIAEKDKSEDPDWTPHQFHFHLVTSLLPYLLRAPPERNIRIIQLVSPGWSAAIPGLRARLEDKPVKMEQGLLPAAGRRGVTSLLFQTHLRLILDTLASATFSKRDVVPDPNVPLEEQLRARDADVQSNILALSVIMPFARDEVVRPVWGEGSILHRILWILLFPLVILLTPSPAKSIQSILFALSAPVKYAADVAEEAAPKRPEPVPVTPAGPAGEGAAADSEAVKTKRKDDDEITDPRRNGVRQGDVVRDCGTVDIPPVLHDRLLARATYDKLEEEVERGVRESEVREKAYAAAHAAKHPAKPEEERAVKFAS